MKRRIREFERLTVKRRDVEARIAEIRAAARRPHGAAAVRVVSVDAYAAHSSVRSARAQRLSLSSARG